VKLLWLSLAFAGFALAQSPDSCWEHRKMSREDQAKACFTQLGRSNDPAVRAEGLWGLGDFAGANDLFRIATKGRPGDVAPHVRWGRLFLDRAQMTDAAAEFQAALKMDKTKAQALLGMALVASESFETKAVEFANQALKADPKLVEAQELLAQLALEDNNEKKAIEEADKAIKLSDHAFDAMAVRGTIDLLNGAKVSPWMERVFQASPKYGEAWATAAHFFILNRRYEEGIAFYRKALELDPLLWGARAELGVNLMRLGEEKEARQNLETCYNAKFQPSSVVNTLRLMDSYKNFETYRTPTTILRLHKKEAALLKPYFQAELDRAIKTYEKKYQFKLGAPVQLEVYPDHEDFAVRTMGMPGLGALGVTFGYVVAMDSPSGRKPGQFHWASTLWHELSHVFVLGATRHRVPRWFTEGMAVHEETATQKDWGDRLDPETIRAMQQKKLLPIAELDRGFVRPSYPSQVIVSYFQAGKICDYINEKWGYGKLLEMMKAFGQAKPTADVVEQVLQIKPADFDREFLAWLDTKVKASVDHFQEWAKRKKELDAKFVAKSWDDVLSEGKAIREFYPEYVEQGSVYEMLADAYVAKGDSAAAVKELERYSTIGGRNPATLKKLAKLQADQGRKSDAAATLERLTFIYLHDEEMHRTLGDLRLETGKPEQAVREYQAVLAMKPNDAAGAHYSLARAFQASKKISEAKEQVFLALEAAPGFKPAQRLLLELEAVKQ
jgi:tetratricopeptide (TPR) repeat protein